MTLINPKNIEAVVSSAEMALEECWEKLVLLQNQQRKSKELFETLLSFQPKLLTSLVELESCYNDVCETERSLAGNKNILGNIFESETSRLARYKRILEGIIDIGKALGDAFAWLFYLKNTRLLKRHYEHEFVSRLPTRIGGKGEVEFIKNCQFFGRYFVLSHSITTFLREGDVSLIDPGTYQVAAVGELKTSKVSDTVISTSIFLIGGRKMSKKMLPTTKANTLQAPKKWDEKFRKRLEKQVKSMKKLFDDPDSTVMPENLTMSLALAELEKLFKRCSTDEWGDVKVGRGLILIAIRCEETPWAKQIHKDSNESDEKFREDCKREPNRLQSLAATIFDKSLPHNALLIDSMFYKGKGRYKLGLKMRPLFWWPLSEEVRKAIMFKKLVVMTIYNPAFFFKALREKGFEVQSKNGTELRVTKKYGAGHMEIIGLPYYYDLIQTQLFSEETIVKIIQSTAESVEKAKIKQTTCVDLDFDFIFD